MKGKDLPGAINVLPAGLGEVLKKRESRELKMEVNIEINFRILPNLFDSL